LLNYQPINDCALKSPAFDGNDLPAEKNLCDLSVIAVTPRDKRNP
jgi:hypothetical protein